jgi:monoterpene epsilon-lactone hydrolase
MEGVSTLIVVVRILGAVLAALARTLWHRLAHGSLVKGWSWSVELRRAALSAVIATAVEHGHPQRWADLRFDAPLPRRLRGVVTVDPGTVGGVGGEWLRLRGLPSGRPTLLYFHGGGHVMGSPGMERPLIAELAVAARADTFSVDYRLAPRHPFPAALDDAVAAYIGLLADGVQPTMLVVGGDSAGGNLAAALLVRLRDEGHPLPAGGVLFSPWLDLAHTGASLVTNAATDYLPAITADPAEAYLDGTEPTDPQASPYHADPTGLPPLLLLAGGREMLLDDSVRFAAKAEEAGVDVTLHVEEHMYHVWPAVIPNDPASHRAVLLAADWIDRHTG